MPLLFDDEPPAFERVNPEGKSRIVLTCDHASRRLPRALGTLGMSDAQLSSHLAWDPGAAEVARGLSHRLDAPLVLSGYSRLAIDCNRPLTSPASVPEVSCEIAVPGNVGVPDEQRRCRQDELFWPYHRAIEQLLEARAAIDNVIVALHSFTPEPLYGKERPWQLGFMYNRDRRLAKELLAALEEEGNVVVGDNQPYQVTDGSDYGIPQYGERAGRLSVLIELRQDVVASDVGIEAMVTLLARCLPGAVARASAPQS